MCGFCPNQNCLSVCLGRPLQYQYISYTSFRQNSDQKIHLHSHASQVEAAHPPPAAHQAGMTTSSAGTPPPCSASFPTCSCGHVLAAHDCTAMAAHPCRLPSLGLLTRKLTRVFPVPVLAQGLVEMHLCTNSQPTSSAIYITLC